MRLSCLKSPLRTLVLTSLLYLLAAVPPQAQSPTISTPYLFASISGNSTSQVAAFAVQPDGTLATVSGSPFPLSSEGGLVTTDPNDRFLFVLNSNSNSISVLSIDPSSGGLSEVAGSPVPTPIPPTGGSVPKNPTGMATFTSGSASYLYVAYRNGQFPSTGAIVAFQIGTPGQAPPLTLLSTISFQATPLQIVANPQGYLYAAFNVVLGSSATPPSPTPGVAVFALNPDPGQLGSPTFVSSNLQEQSLALNPAATFLFDGSGSPAIGAIGTSPTQPGTAPSAVRLSSPNSPPSAMVVDGTGQLLYVQQGGRAAVYVIDRTTGVLSPTSTVPPFSVKSGNIVADPVKHYLYTIDSTQLHSYEIVDFTTGAVMERTGLPYSIPTGAGGLAITHNAARQAVEPHAATLLPPSINFIDTVVNTSSSVSTAVLTNAGTQPLNINSIMATGADGTSFAASTCPAQLPVESSCTIYVKFTPTQSGALQAPLAVIDDAGTQTILLTGNGVDGAGSGGSGSGGSGSGGSGSGGSGGTGGSGSGGSGSGGSGGTNNPPPQPSISIAPSSLSFTSTALNATVPQKNVAITNIGAGPLQISNTQITGPNASDFALTNFCTSQSYAQHLGCTVSVTFTPSALGSRSASLIVTSNDPVSPQSTVALAGSTESAAVTITPLAFDGFSETISAGQTATYQLNLESTFNGTISFSPCAGAPTGATCTVPGPISVVANQIAPLTITVATAPAASSTFLDKLDHLKLTPQSIVRLSFPAACALLFLLLRRRTENTSRSLPAGAPWSNVFPFSANVASAALLAFSALTFTGCGGASTVATAPAVTPASQSQTYTITITPIATLSNNLPVNNIQPLQLKLIVN
jgi:6-phosphogluconolactonase (cycloisomerase 2 family)